MLCEAANERLKVIHGDIMKFNMEEEFPADLKTSWDDGNE